MEKNNAGIDVNDKYQGDSDIGKLIHDFNILKQGWELDKRFPAFSLSKNGLNCGEQPGRKKLERENTHNLQGGASVLSQMDWGFFEDHEVYEDGKWKKLYCLLLILMRLSFAGDSYLLRRLIPPARKAA